MAVLVTTVRLLRSDGDAGDILSRYDYFRFAPVSSIACGPKQAMSRMRSQHLPMTWEEFELLPMHPGWKHEYWDGQAHVSPRHRVAVVRIATSPRTVSSPCPIRRMVEEDEAALRAAYVAAFADTVEYCDWEPAKVEDSASEAIRNFFAGKQGEVLPASCLATVPGAMNDLDRIAGAALVTRTREAKPLLRILFVTPRWQRRGLAASLVSTAINELYGAGEQVLQSSYHLGNDASVAWHRKFGFVEEPDLLLAELYYRCSGHELWRREKMGNLMQPEQARLAAEHERWKNQMDDLRRIADQHGIEAVLPSLRC
jgi:GNAT superfamily N-acetyltransferase